MAECSLFPGLDSWLHSSRGMHFHLWYVFVALPYSWSNLKQRSYAYYETVIVDCHYPTRPEHEPTADRKLEYCRPSRHVRITGETRTIPNVLNDWFNLQFAGQIRCWTALWPFWPSFGLCRSPAMWFDSHCHGWSGNQPAGFDCIAVLRWYPGRDFCTVSGLVYWLLWQEDCWDCQLLVWGLG